MLTCTRSAEQFREADFTSLNKPGSSATKHDQFPNGFKQGSNVGENAEPATGHASARSRSDRHTQLREMRVTQKAEAQLHHGPSNQVESEI